MVRRAFRVVVPVLLLAGLVIAAGAPSQAAVPDTPVAPITVGAHPLGVAITPDGATAYVTNTNDNTVTPISVATNTPGAPIPVGGPERGGHHP